MFKSPRWAVGYHPIVIRCSIHGPPLRCPPLAFQKECNVSFHACHGTRYLSHCACHNYLKSTNLKRPGCYCPNCNKSVDNA
ncbi:hypothetical protein BDN67DRAFT_346201 [Paxillus ammoniavirescens]|nr:hypothetical protein BDN67DRAFT_346201 [Paxillus ammoniavirescens]